MYGWNEFYKDVEVMNKKIEEFSSLMRDVTIPDSFISWLKNRGFFYAPASRSYHGAYFGGLFDHSKCVTERLVEMTERNHLVWQNPRSPYIIGMFHDLCKIDMYERIYDDNGNFLRFERDKKALDGHGAKSVALLKEHFGELTEEEELCIKYHMGAFTEKEEWKGYEAAGKKYENVLWTHHADIIAAYTYNT